MELQKFLQEFQKTSKTALEAFVDKAESVLPHTLLPTYKQLVQDAAKVLTLGYLSDDPQLRALADMMNSKHISITLLSKYIVLVGFMLPLASAQSNPATAKKVQAAIREFHSYVSQLSNIKVSQEGEVLIEGFIKNILTKIKDALWSALKKVGMAIAVTLSALIRLYNTIFERITAPLRSVISRLPGGEYITSASFSAFTSLTTSPLLGAALTIHKALTSPIAVGGARLVSMIQKGTLWQNLDKMFEDIEKEVGFEDIDKEFGGETSE